MRIVYRLNSMQQVVDRAIEILKELSPVGSIGDKHPGLYRDSHMIFLNGNNVKEVHDAPAGSVIHISNPIPYSRKIESGRMKMSVPGHTYERTEAKLRLEFTGQAQIRLIYMPVRFGSMQAFINSSTAKAFGSRRPGGRVRRDYADWIARQPALEIRAA